MAAYVFEAMSQQDAANFDADDILVFFSNGATASQVTASSTNPGFGGSATQLSFAGKSLIFPADGLSAASQAGNVQFNDETTLVIGTSGDNDDLTLGTPANPTVAPGSAVFGLGGSDEISNGNGNDYLYGGTDGTPSANLSGGIETAGMGGDTITAGDGNNHIYGQALGTQQGAIDGNDLIVAGAGTNYVNGNAGNDSITVGEDDSTGANRVLGGSGNDDITINGAGANTVNGNLGNDMIDASDATFNNTLRGGQGSDTIMAGSGQDLIMGDVGNDTLVAGTGGAMMGDNGNQDFGHLTVMMGGVGNDRFDFSGDDAGNAGIQQGQNNVYSGVIVDGQTYWQTIGDFTQGQDQIDLGFNIATSDDIVRAGDGVSFTTVSSAQIFAQQILNNNTSEDGEVAALNVNGNTYLFYNSEGTGDIDSIVQLNGVSANTLTQGGSGVVSFTPNNDGMVGGA